MRIVKLDEQTKKNILEDLLKRSPNSYGEFEQRVADIVDNVKENGDKAIFDYTQRFDGVKVDAQTIRVTEDEIKEAYEKVSDELLQIIRKALKNIEDYHVMQRQQPLPRRI